ncbi:polysaccharide deacetylase family protein [Streptacidiphilus rugosus]|uniref:polysaccharide deacetylase family protein n=1 Tax=Streptacidiphilus rugosus TaxID=405783 RepID=UPI000AED0FFE|nr:polysaccharide deacetylase family protein [Streptacidiphilus rugosus]
MAAEPLQGERSAPGELVRLTQQATPDGAADTAAQAGPPDVAHAARPDGTFTGRAPWTLMYHSVDVEPDDPYLVTVSPQRFARQMEWLRRTGRRGVSMRELLLAHERGSAAGLVGLTFDDGYADFPREVLPVLLRHGFNATAYIVAGRMGGHNAWDADGPRKPLLTIAQVRQLASAGVEIGSHSLSHRRMVGLSEEDLALETRRSKELLEAVVDAPVTGFCYPYGALDAAAEAAVGGSGYDYGVGIAHPATPSRWALPRCYVGERDGGLRLRAKRLRHTLRGWRS